MRATPLVLLALSSIAVVSAAPVPQAVIKTVPIPPADPDAVDFDKPPKGALRRLGSRQMRHPLGGVGGFTADGRTLFTAGYGIIREWDADTNTLRRTIPIADTTNVMRLKITPDAGKLLFDDFNTLHVFDRTTKQRLHALRVPDQAIERFAVSPDGKMVAVGTRQGHVRLFDLATGKDHDLDLSHPPPFRRREPPGIASLAWSPDGKTLVTTAFRGGVRAWDPKSGEELWVLPPEASDGGIAFTPDGKQLITSLQVDANSYQAGLWDLATRRPKELRGFVTGDGLCVSRDGRYFSHGSQIWDTKADRWTHSFPLAASADSAAFSREGKRLAVGANGVRLFDVETGKELLDDTGHAGQVVGISVTPDGKLAATAGRDGTARVWDVATGKLLHTFRANLGAVNAVSLSPDGKRLAVGDRDEVRVFDLAAGKKVWEAEGHSQLTQVAFSPDGGTVAVGGGSLTVHLYDAGTGKPIRKLVGYTGGMNAAWHFAWTPDSAGIVSPVNLMPGQGGVPVGGPGGEGDGKHRFVLWEVKTGNRLRVIGEPVERFDTPVAVDAEGLHAAFCRREGVTLVEFKTGRVKWTADVNGWNGLAFTGDDKLYAGGVCLDSKTGKKEAELKVGPQRLMALAVPVAGKVVLTAAWDDNTAVVWGR